MKINIESTSKVIHFVIDGVSVPARIWEGTTERGTPVVCFVTRISPTIPNPPADIQKEFERDLKETRVPSAFVRAYPLSLIL